MSVTTDADWVTRSFMVMPKVTQQGALNRRVSNSAQYKFTDTTVGGNRYINSWPQFTSNADIKERPYNVSKGMGRFYSECYDDNAIVAHMRFGIAQHNSLSGFFLNFFSPAMSYITNTGETPPLAFRIGEALTFVSTLGYQTLVYAARAFGGFVNFLLRKPYSQYYYMKPAMPLYWNAVNTIVNYIGVNKGIISPVVPEEASGGGVVPKPMLAGEMRAYAQLMPDIFEMTEDKQGIDVYALANRAQRLSDLRLEYIERDVQAAQTKEEYERAVMQVDADGNPLPINAKEINSATLNLPNYLKAWSDGVGKYNPGQEMVIKDSDGQPVTIGPDRQPVTVQPNLVPIDGHEKSYLEKLAMNMTANRRDGSEWVSFKIDPERTMSESFSSSTGESEVSSKLKGISSANNSFMFSLGGGNLGDGAIANFAESVLGGIKNFATGVANQLHVGGLLGLISGAFPDIPEQWMDSVASLPSASFSVQLRAPYGHPMSGFLNCDIPLAMLLAGALPMSKGRASYGSPFLVEYYCKSRSQVRLGIIEELSITRGAGSHGWTVDQYTRGIDVQVTIKDLSTIMHMPVTESISLVDDVLGMGMFADDTKFTDYMAILGGLGVESQIYPMQQMARKRFLGLEKFDDWASPSHLASYISGTLPGRLMSAMSNTRFNQNTSL